MINFDLEDRAKSLPCYSTVNDLVSGLAHYHGRLMRVDNKIKLRIGRLSRISLTRNTDSPEVVASFFLDDEEIIVPASDSWLSIREFSVFNEEDKSWEIVHQGYCFKQLLEVEFPLKAKR